MTTRLHEAVLRSSREVNHQTRHFELEMADGAALDYRPGQYISLEFAWQGRHLARPCSIASAPRPDGRFDLCLKMVHAGAGSGWFQRLKPGERIRFRGPFGTFVLREPLDPVTAFIVTGTGVAPIRAMIQQALRRPTSSEVWLLFGVQTEADILYRREFEELARANPNFHFVPTLSRPSAHWKGHRAYVQKHLERYFANQPGLHAYICGVKAMVDEVRHRFVAMGYDRKALSYEKYE